MRKIIIYFSLFVLLETVFNNLGLAQQADSMIVWEPIKRISYDTLDSWLPRVKTSGTNVYLIWLTSGAETFFARSTDNGTTWLDPTYLIKSYPPIRKSNIYAVSGDHIYFYSDYDTTFSDYLRPFLWFKRSTNQGEIWEDGKIISDSNKTGWNLSAYGSNIVINYSPFVGYDEQLFGHSSDHGVSWTYFNKSLLNGDRPEIALLSNVLYEVREGTSLWSWEVTSSYSTDYGATWAPEIFLSTYDSIESYKPHIAADILGNVYVVWYDGKYGSSTGWGGTVLLRRSTDYGQTWLPERILSENPTGLWPRVSVSGKQIAVCWANEIQNDSGKVINTVHFRYSRDYGQNWSNEYELSSGGDPDVVIDSKYVHVTWGDTTTKNVYEIFYRRGKLLTTNVIDDKFRTIPSEFELAQNYPNPFNPTTTIEFTLLEPSIVTLKVYNLLGQEVKTIIDNELMEDGLQANDFDASDLTSGVYFYKITAQGVGENQQQFQAIKRMVLVK